MSCLQTGDGDQGPKQSYTCEHLIMLNDHFRMLQAGPGSGANPSEIKESLKTGLDCLKMGLAILEVITFGNLTFF